MSTAYEGMFTSSDGRQFFERRWEADAPNAHVVLVHGFGEHCSRYGHFAAALNQAGLTVHTYDQRGFGRSPGQRAVVADFDLLLHDFDHYLAQVRPRFQGKPWFLLGHSMGGLVVAPYAETRTFDARGLVFCSPFLDFSDDIPKVLIRLADILGILAPWLPVKGVDNRYLARDPQVVQDADEDPISFHGHVRVRTGAEFNRTLRAVQAEFSKISSPLFIAHGTDDKIVPITGSGLLYQTCSSSDKTLKTYEGGYHELWNDLCKEDLFADINAWITARI